MSFTITQQPERLTPAHTEHVYNIYSANNTKIDYKYLVNVFMFPYNWTGTDREIVATLKIRPNSEGRAILDIQEIIQSIVTPNIQVDLQNDYTDTDIMIWPAEVDSQFTSKPTLWGAFSRANANTDVTLDKFYSAPGLPAEYHVVEYRIMIGEEWTEADGTKYTFVSNGANYPEEVGQVVPFAIGTWTADYPSIQATDFFGDQFTTTADVGVDWYHKDSTETTTYEVGQELTATSTFETLVQPAAGDRMIVKSIYSKKEWVFYWQTNPEARDTGWVFLEIRFDDDYPYYYGQFMPPSVLTWVGADNTLQRQDLTLSSLNPQNINNHLHDWLPWYMYNKQDMEGRSPHYGKFLNVGGEEIFETRNEGDGDISVPIRRRSIYPGEPVMVSFFNSYCFEFVNEIRMMVSRHSFDDNPNTFITEYEYNIRDHGGGPLTTVTDTYPTLVTGGPQSLNLLHYTKNDFWDIFYGPPSITPKFIEFNTWGFVNDPSTTLPYKTIERASEVFRFEVKDLSCLGTPVYFVFLNSNGGWDTFTFGARSTKTYDIDRKTYDKSANYNSSIYTRQSWFNKSQVYDSNISIRVEADTDYLKEYDSIIVEDLIRSNEVYIVENNQVEDYVPAGSTSSTLIPVKILTSSVQEYNKKYQKLFQHSIEFEISSIKDYNSSL